MAVDRAEEQKLESMMMTAAKTGCWENVANELNDRTAGSFYNRQQDLADTTKAAAAYCDKHGFPMTVILDNSGGLEEVKDTQNSNFLRGVGVKEANGGQFMANDKL